MSGITRVLDPEFTFWSNKSKTRVGVKSHGNGSTARVQRGQNTRMGMTEPKTTGESCRLLTPTLHAGFWALLAARRAVTLSERALAAVSLGLLSGEDLVRMTTATYRRDDRYLGEKNVRAGLKDWEAEAIEAHFPRKGKALVLAAGGGREVVALRERGLDVFAADCDRRYVDFMRDFFRRDAYVRRIDLVPPNEAPSGLEDLDAALIGWGGYTHVPSREDRVALLRKLAAMTKPGAPIMISFWAERPPKQGRLDKAVFQAARVLQSLTRTRAGGPREGDRIAVPGIYGYLFSRAEIESEVREAGLRLISYRAKPYGCAVAARE